MARAARGEAEAFLTAAMSAETNECILWPFGRCGAYGAYRKAMAHAEVCRREHGERPAKGYEAAHSCGNKLCINRYHLRWLTQSGNVQGRFVLGEQPLGIAHHNAKLSQGAVCAIRADSRGSKAIASEFGVSARHVRKIRAGKSRWREYA